MKPYSRALIPSLLVLLAAGTASPSRADSKLRLDGLWGGVIVFEPAQIELDVTLEIAPSPLVGTLDIPIVGLRFQPLQDLSLQGSQVAFRVDRFPDRTGPDDLLQFHGALSPDGASMDGEFSGSLGGKELHLPFHLDRKGEAGGERPPQVKPPLTVLSAEGSELRSAFNRDRDKARLVLLLSPTCGSCLSNAWVVQKYVLGRIKDERVQVYVIWGPMQGDEKRENAEEATARMTDPRVTHFWTPDDRLSAEFARAASLPKGESGWDTFQLFAPAATWGDSLPAPARFMYMEKPLPKEQVFNGEKLADWVLNALRGSPSTDRRTPGRLLP